MAKPSNKFKFLIDVEVEAQGEVVFKAEVGEVVELSTASANHWLKRNKAAIHIQSKVEAKPDAQIKASPKKKSSK